MCRDCGCSTRPLIMNQQNSPPLVGTLNIKEVKPIIINTQTSPQDLTTRKISVEESIFQKNLNNAKKNSELFTRSGLRVFNFMSSPGSGKTTLLSRVLPNINAENKVLVLVGDQETSFDAEKLIKAGIESIQINTKASCHLDAQRISAALPKSDLKNFKYLIIENVGNLVCPAAFELGEQFKVAVLSVTEGEEKPLKYPLLFEDAHLIVITKADLLPYLDYDRELLTQNLRLKNKNAKIIWVSAKTGEGLIDLQNEMENMTCA